jgi:hypothetical protein
MKQIIFILVAILASTMPASAKYSGGTGQANDPYLISSAQDFNSLADNFTDWGKYFLLASDIDMLTYPGDYKIIGNQSMNFTGTFDGSQHIIKNLIFTSNSMHVGLFGYTSNAVIKNLHLEDVNITSTAHATGAVIGAQVGGSILNCSSKGIVKTAGNPSLSQLGGLVGRTDGNIINCFTEGSVSSISTSSGTICRVGGLIGGQYGGNIETSFCTADVNVQTSFLAQDFSYVGGLAGYCNGSIENCFSSGSVNCSSSAAYAGGFTGYLNNAPSQIENCYSTGLVSTTGAHAYKGGLISYSLGTVTSCFWDVNTSGLNSSAAGTGKTTAEMKMLSTFTNAGWDFVDVWGIGNFQTYPYLKPFNGFNSQDLNYSGLVDFQDFAIFAEHWLQGL